MVKKYLRAILLFVVLLPCFYGGYYFFVPDVARLQRWHPPQTSFMEYRMRQWEQQGRKQKIQQTWVSLPQISPYVIKAVIIAEDDKFWSHEGFDFEAMQKALAKDIQKKKFRVGGSTISQQLVKNLYLLPEKSIARKIKEAIITWRIERKLAKKRIIELYLNVAEWGDGLFGVEAAARHYYGKSAFYLTAIEAARLAVMLPNPLKYQVLGTSRYLETRSEIIYRIMVRRGIVIPEYEAVMGETKDTPPLGALPVQGQGSAVQGGSNDSVAGMAGAESGNSGRQEKGPEKGNDP
jgi:monofunctional biosynthetic peptidoglycan transglycosylase